MADGEGNYDGGNSLANTLNPPLKIFNEGDPSKPLPLVQELRGRERYYPASQVAEMIRISEERAYFRGIVIGDIICYKNGISKQMEDLLLVLDNRKYEGTVPLGIRETVDLGHKTKAIFKKEFTKVSLPIERQNLKEPAIREVQAEKNFPKLMALYESNKEGQWYRKPEECEEQDYEEPDIDIKSL